MKYLIGKSKQSTKVYTALMPDDSHFETEENRAWEKEITKDEFDKLNKIEPMDFMLMGHRITSYTVLGY